MRISERSGGIYSEALHADAEPGSTRAWRQGHVRRLEALRREGIAGRRNDGTWSIPENFADKAMGYDASRTGRIELQVRSWLPLKDQVRHAGLTWLDSDAAEFPGDNLAAVRAARLEFLRQKGWLGDGISEIDETLRNRLRAMELRRTSEALAAATGRGSVELTQGERFEGRFEKAVDLGQGRLALIGNAREFALVPWRPEMKRHRGREMTVTPTARGVSWTIGIGRGLGR